MSGETSVFWLWLSAGIVVLGISVFSCGVAAGIYYFICLTVKGVKALFRRKGKTESEDETVSAPEPSPLSIFTPSPSYDLIDKILKLMDQYFEVVKDLQKDIDDLEERIDDLEERVEELELHESEKQQEAVEEFKRTTQETEKFVAEQLHLINEKITGSTKILDASILRLHEIIKESKK